MPDDLEAHARDGPGLDGARGDRRCPRRRRSTSWPLVDRRRARRRCAAATRCEHRAPRQRRASPGDSSSDCDGVGLPEAHDLEHRERVVPGGVVDDLHHPDRAHLLAEGEGVDGDAGVAEARVDARRVEASCRPPGRRPRAGRSTPAPAAAGYSSGTNDVFTTFLPDGQHPADVVDHLVGAEVGVGRVADAVGVEGEQGVDVLGGDDARRARRRTARRRRGRPCRRSAPRGPASSRSGWATRLTVVWLGRMPVRRPITSLPR